MANFNQNAKPLWEAASSDNRAELLRILANRVPVDVDECDSRGRTALYMAAENGHTEVCGLLIDAGASYTHGDYMHHRDPLWIASKNGHISTCLLLLERGAEQISDDSDMTPLHAASQSGHLRVCSIFLDRGDASTGDRDFNGDTPLHCAASGGHADLCSLLLDRGAEYAATNDDGETPLAQAVISGHLKVCEMLLERGAPADMACGNGITLLYFAAWFGHRDVCALLTDKGATHSPLVDGRTPLYIAVERGHVDVCELLLDRGATLAPPPPTKPAAATTSGTSLMHVAMVRFNPAVCSMLLDRGATQAPDCLGRTPLHLAASARRYDMCKLLLDRGATHAADLSGMTPLHEAVSAAGPRAIDVCSLLLDRGATHVPNAEGATPLISAVKKRSLKLCDFLLKRGADHTPDHKGRTPLYWAVYIGYIPIITKLLKHGARVDDPDSDVTSGWERLATDNSLHMYIRAVLAQQAPHLFSKMSYTSFPASITSVTALIYVVHAFMQHQPHRSILEIAYREMVNLRDASGSLLELIEVIAAFSTQSRSFFETGLGLSRDQKLAIARGMCVRSMWNRSRDYEGRGDFSSASSSFARLATTMFRQKPSGGGDSGGMTWVSQRKMQWWVWRHVLVAAYGIPVAWTSEAFWTATSAQGLHLNNA